MSKTSRRALRRLRAALAPVSWINLVVGMSLGVVGYWVLGRALGDASNQTDSAVELGLGVLLGGVVGWVIPELIKAIRTRWAEQKPLRSLIGPACVNRHETVIYMASLYPKQTLGFLKSVPDRPGDMLEVTPKTAMPWVVVENDALALGYVMAVLAQAGKSQKLQVTRDDLGLDRVEVNMICIGSIKSNYMTAKINSAFVDLPLRFAWVGEELTITDGSTTWRMDDEYDHAILVKATNEYAPGRCVWICAGISHFGTVSAAYLLFSRWPELHEAHGDGNFGLVLRARRDNTKYVEIVRELSVAPDAGGTASGPARPPVEAPANAAAGA